MRGAGSRFVVVGGATVLLDLLVYRMLLRAGAPAAPSKAASFVVGALFAYVANWRFTFRGASHRWSPVLFAVVYLCALALNVGVNAAVLAALDDGVRGRVLLAFVVATGVSATWNFVGMALFVFRRGTRRSPVGSS